jgi:phosphatidylserine/phosphatidylglycerophosphate/cardiolipin synthase-like enzyme
MFLPGVALVFLHRDSGEQQTAITIDGRISEIHETSFALLDGPEKASLVADISGKLTDEAPSLPLEARRLSIERPELDALVERHAGEVAAVEGESRTETADSNLTSEGTTGDQQSVQRQLESLSVRPLQTYEHQTVLQEALEGSERRLLILSPWIRGDVVNDGFVDALWALARRGVEIHIGYGISRNPEDQDEWPIQKLQRLANENSNVTFKHLGNTHAKILISDDRMVVTSFNWLSFRGTRQRRYRQEEGVLIQDARLTESQYERHRGMF